jgi:hypothetical protein
MARCARNGCGYCLGWYLSYAKETLILRRDLLPVSICLDIDASCLLLCLLFVLWGMGSLSVFSSHVWLVKRFGFWVWAVFLFALG